jgi:hypothetical protein
MNKSLSLSIKTLVPAFLLVLASAGVSRAEGQSPALQERFQASVNTMVQSVQAAPDPAAKRAIIGSFLNRVDRGMEMAQGALPAKDGIALDLLRAKVQAQFAELNGLNGQPKVADNELNHFAGYIQQDMEQAQAYWGGGGIYLSVGAIIIILILILLLR